MLSPCAIAPHESCPGDDDRAPRPAASRRAVAATAAAAYRQSMTETRDEAKPPGTAPPAPPESNPAPKEIGGRAGPEPTRYGDWEVNGRCTDF
jgi:hypothetical protein